jgi:hypothetical protein
VRIALAGLCLLLMASGSVGCATRSSPWNVPKGHEDRYRATRKLCHDLTDSKDGTYEPKLFENCMKRRGFKRQNAFQRVWKGLTGG